MNILISDFDLITSSSDIDYNYIKSLNNIFLTQASGSVDIKFAIDGDFITVGPAVIELKKISTYTFLNPGPFTLKFVYDLLVYLKSLNDTRNVLIQLPEYWLLTKIEKLDRFSFEAFYTYISLCLSAGYDNLLINCASEASASYYTRTMLGGFVPNVKALSVALRDFGLNSLNQFDLG